MKSSMTRTFLFVIALLFVVLFAVAMFAPMSNIAYADDQSKTSQQEEEKLPQAKSYAAAIAVGLAAAAGAIGMAIAVAKSNESIARQPEAEGKIRSNMMLGLVFIETAIIYALLIAIIIIFVL